jgi:hypothetical protein
VFVVHIGIHVVTAAAPILTELAKAVTDPDEGRVNRGVPRPHLLSVVATYFD